MKITVRLLSGILLLVAGFLLLTVYVPFMLSFLFGMCFLLAGIVLLATAGYSKKKDLKKPVGVTIVGVLVMLGSIGLGFLSMVGFVLSLVGGHGGGGISPYVWVLAGFLIVFALSGFSLSIVVLQGNSSKNLWRALMAYWISLVVFSLIQDFANGYVINLHRFVPIFRIWYLPVYVLPAICIMYFLTKKPRQYYHLIAVNSPV